MADDQELDFVPVEATKRIQGSANRDPDGAEVHSTGLTETNVGGGEVMDRVAIAYGLDVKNYSVKFGVKSKTGLIAVYPVSPGDDGTEWVKHTKSRTAKFHLGGVFEKYPQLRPTSARHCPVVEGVDGKGRKCAIIAVTGSYTKRSSSGNSKNTATPKQDGGPAAAK